MTFATLVSQQQAKKSTDYDDSKSPSLANYQTNSADLGDDLNSLFSAIQNLLNRDGASFPTGNWYDDLTAPTALENGSERGLNSLNDALHLLEKKRILRQVTRLADVTVPTAAAATNTLTLTANFSDTETVTIGTQTYTMQATLTDSPDNVLIGATANDSIDNLVAAINNGAGEGTVYGTGTTENADVTAANGGSDTMDVTAKKSGTAANAVDTTETSASAIWTTATLTGGAGDLVILGTGELPTQTTAAIGAVTTLGTVVATASPLGTATLNEVAGLTAVNPKNLLEIFDASSGDPLLSTGGKKIWGLLQYEDDTDGSTITDTSPNRVQIVFVQTNATNDDLEIVDGVDTGDAIVNYAYRERVRQEDLNEQDFLSGAAVDIGAGAVTVSRQVAYDNQGTTPVDLTTNADLDLAGGVAWGIRDANSSDILLVTEGSGGGTTEVRLGANTDTFNNDAAANDFSNGMLVASTHTRPINVGPTDVGGTDDGVIQTTAGDLEIRSATELFLDDANQAGSSWAQTAGIKLSETTTEWDDFETNFGGEVSILNALNQAVQAGGVDLTTVTATVTANVAADTDVSGPSNDNNLDTDLGDLSGGTFTTAVKCYLNGVRLISAANDGAGGDVYPGTSLANGQLKFQGAIESGWKLIVDHFTP